MNSGGWSHTGFQTLNMAELEFCPTNRRHP
jgi:hypothetical protein